MTFVEDSVIYKGHLGGVESHIILITLLSNRLWVSLTRQYVPIHFQCENFYTQCLYFSNDITT
jgi:hypothetical protein